MTTGSMGAVIGQVRRLLQREDQEALSDAQLLGTYVDQRAEEAFAALVRRHGPMVWGVCRRLLRNPADAEDAYQATFLVLVRKAASVWPRERLGPWLHGVAYLTARKARALALRRLAREKPLRDLPEHPAPTEDHFAELRPVLDRELHALPERYRTLLVLCDLEGLTRRAVAEKLGCPEGTVAGRLARARNLLARRLSRHGPLLSVPGLVALLAAEAAGSPPAWLPGTLPCASRLLVLTEGVLPSMSLRKLFVGVGLLCAAGGLLLGLGLVSPAIQAGVTVSPGVAAPVQEPKAPPEQKVVRQQLQGMRWYLLQADPEEHTLRVTDTPPASLSGGLSPDGDILLAESSGRLQVDGLPVAKDAKLTLDGKPAQWRDLRPGLQLTLRFADDASTIVALEAKRPLTGIVVQAVNVERSTITVAIGPERTLRELPVAPEVYIYLYHIGNTGQLKDVAAGMHATLKLTMQQGRFVVTDLRASK